MQAGRHACVYPPYTHKCMRTYTHNQTGIHAYIYIHPPIHTYTKCTHMLTYIQAYMAFGHTRIHTGMHAYIRNLMHRITHIHTCILSGIHTYRQTCTHIYTVIHTHSHPYIQAYIHTRIREYTTGEKEGGICIQPHIYHTHIIAHMHTYT